MSLPETVVLIVRLLGYVGMALLCLFVIPVYHRSFRLTWRAIGVFFVLTMGTVFVRLLGGSALSLAYNDYVLTPTLIIVLMATFYNLRLVGRWKGEHRHG